MRFDDGTGVRPGLIAVLFLVLGSALIVPVLSDFWPTSLLPPPTGRSDYAHNLRILKLMMLAEGVGLGLLGVLAWRQHSLLRSFGGVAVLESHTWLTLGALFVVHVLGLLLFLPPQQILSGDPIYTANNAAHFYRVFAAQQRLAGGGGLGGYDPFLNAGSQLGINPDSRGAELFASAFAFLGLAQASKLWVLLVELLLPIAVWATARLVGLRRDAAWFAVLLTLLYWHGGRPFLGHYRWSGAHSFLFVCLVALVVIGLAVRFLMSRAGLRLRCLVAAWLLLAVAGFIHPLGILLPSLPLLALSIWGLSAVRRRGRIVLGLGLVTLVLLHATWLLPLIQARTELPVAAASLRLQGLAGVFETMQQTSMVPLYGIALLALAGALTLSKRNNLALVGIASLALFASALLVWGYALPGVRRFDTARFMIPAVLAACILAGFQVAQLSQRWQRQLGAPLVVLLLATAATGPAFAAILDTRFFYVHRVHATLNPTFHQLMNRLQEDSQLETRVLFESTRRGWIMRNGGDGALEALVPVFTHREVIGLTHPELATTVNGLSFRDGQLAGRPLAAWSTADFESFLERYNIGTVVAWTPAAQRFLQGQRMVLHAAEPIGKVAVFAVRQTWPTLLLGEAEVRADYNRIELHNIRGEDLVLRYHWHERLATTPDVPMRPADLPEDSTKFIHIRPEGHTQIIVHW